MTTGEKLAVLRKKQGWSQEETAQKLDVSRQAVSKWESGSSVPDAAKIIMLSELYGVSTDYILKEDETAGNKKTAALRTVSLKDAVSFMDIIKKHSKFYAAGVMLCILSPVCLIFLLGLTDTGIIDGRTAVITGVSVILIFVAAAVAMFIYSGSRVSEYEYLEKEMFSLAPGVKEEVLIRKEEYKNKNTLLNITGTVLCILSAVPLIALSVSENKNAVLPGVCLLLVIVSAGVFSLVLTGFVRGSFDKLMQVGEYTREEKAFRPFIGTVSAVYWLTVTAGFLVYGFITASWENSGYIWAVAGILYFVIIALAKVIKKTK